MIFSTTSIWVALGLTNGRLDRSLSPTRTLLLVASMPAVERLPADAVVAARLGDVAGDLLGVTDHLQAMLCLPLELLFRHAGLPSALADSKRPQVSSICVSSRPVVLGLTLDTSSSPDVGQSRFVGHRVRPIAANRPLPQRRRPRRRGWLRSLRMSLRLRLPVESKRCAANQSGGCLTEGG